MVHPEPIRVSYQRVRELVPSFWDAGDAAAPYLSREGRTPDVAVHIGMAGPRPFYQIERRGHRQGYTSRDVDGRMLEDEEPAGHGSGWLWYGCPEELETELDMVDVLKRWKGLSPVSISRRLFFSSLADSDIPKSDMDLRISDDAGHYLCDFTYYSSLAHLWKQQRPRRVTFFHVPADASERAVASGRELVLNLIRAIVESEVSRRKGRKPGENDDL